jgi:hypothetical protein
MSKPADEIGMGDIGRASLRLLPTAAAAMCGVWGQVG